MPEQQTGSYSMTMVALGSLSGSGNAQNGYASKSFDKFLEHRDIIANRPMDDKTVEWLFKNPLSDGGTFCGVADAVMKYGLVPAEVMPESYQANNTSRLSSLIALKLREYGLTLRQMAADGAKPAALANKKQEMLATVRPSLWPRLPPSEPGWRGRYSVLRSCPNSR